MSSHRGRQFKQIGNKPIWKLENDLVFSFFVKVDFIDCIRSDENDENNEIKRELFLDEDKKIVFSLEFVQDKETDTYLVRFSSENNEDLDKEEEEIYIYENLESFVRVESSEKFYQYLKNKNILKVNLRLLAGESNLSNDDSSENFYRWIIWMLNLLSIEIGCKIILYEAFEEKNFVNRFNEDFRLLGFYTAIPSSIPLMFLNNAIKLLPNFPQFAYLELYHVLEYLINQDKLNKFEKLLKRLVLRYANFPKAEIQSLYKEYSEYFKKTPKDKEKLKEFLVEYFKNYSPQEFFNSLSTEEQNFLRRQDIPFLIKGKTLKLKPNDNPEDFANRLGERIYKIRNAIAHAEDDINLFKIEESEHIDFLQMEVSILLKLILNIIIHYDKELQSFGEILRF